MPKKTEKKKDEKQDKPSQAKEKKRQSKKTSIQEFEKKVLELADKGLTSEKIGENLRKEGIHPKEHSKKISKILKDKEKYINPDIKNLEEKFEHLKKHLEKNKQDKKAMRDKDKAFSQLRKLKRYHKEI